MSNLDLVIYTLKFAIPSIFCFLFRSFGLGYKNRSRLILGFFVYASYISIILPTLIMVMGYEQFTHVVSLVLTIGALAALIVSSDPPSKTILLILICAQMNTVVSVLLNMVRDLLGLSYLTLDILMLLVCSVTYLIALRYWVKPLRYIVDNMYHRLTAAMPIPMITTIIIYLIPVYPERNFVVHPMYCTVLMLAVELTFFLYIYMFYRSMQQISTLSAQKLNTDILQLATVSVAERQRLMDEAVYQQSIVTHDCRHFNCMVLELLEQDRSEEAIAFLRQQIQPKLSYHKNYCDNIAVNAAVSYYATLAEEKGITTNIKLQIPNKLAFDSLEFAMAISNLMENAIHGCQALSARVEKQIYFSCRFSCRQVGRLAMEITNPCTADTILNENGSPVSRQEGHGIGTKSVLAFATKYDGELFYHIENNIFSVRMIL